MIYVLAVKYNLFGFEIHALLCYQILDENPVAFFLLGITINRHLSWARHTSDRTDACLGRDLERLESCTTDVDMIETSALLLPFIVLLGLAVVMNFASLANEMKYQAIINKLMNDKTDPVIPKICG